MSWQERQRQYDQIILDMAEKIRERMKEEKKLLACADMPELKNAPERLSYIMGNLNIRVKTLENLVDGLILRLEDFYKAREQENEKL